MKTCIDHSSFWIVALCIAIAGSAVNVNAHAQSNTVYKCTKNGKVEYSNAPCDAQAKPAVLKGTVTSVPKEAFVGKPAAGATAAPAKTILGITPPNPIEDCRKKGGKIDLELRACIVP